MNYLPNLTISEEKMAELKRRIVTGIKKNLPSARHLCGINNETATGIYIYAVEELGKLILLRDCQKQNREYIIEYARKYRKHPVKFKLDFDLVQKIHKSDCIVLNDKGGFDIGLLP